MEELRNSKGQTIKEALEGIVYPPCHNLTIAERDWWEDVAILYQRLHETATEEIEKNTILRKKQISILSDQIMELKSQIPDKPGKKLSQKDKEVLSHIASWIQVIPPSPLHEKEEEDKLLKRLMK